MAQNHPPWLCPRWILLELQGDRDQVAPTCFPTHPHKLQSDWLQEGRKIQTVSGLGAFPTFLLVKDPPQKTVQPSKP